MRRVSAMSRLVVGGIVRYEFDPCRFLPFGLCLSGKKIGGCLFFLHGWFSWGMMFGLDRV
jgi:hypothetical protein